jgi:hypothetical protein
MFPLEFKIEPEDMTLTPVDTDLPVFFGPSISLHDGYRGKSAFYFIRTITYEQYRALTRWTDDMDLTWRRFDCHFKTTKAENATTIWVQNDEFFNYTDNSQASFSNIDKAPREKINYFYVEAADDEGCQVRSASDGIMYLQTKKVNENTEYWVKEEGWSGSTGKSITLEKGDRVYFKAGVKNWSGEDKLKVDGNFNVGGNIASLVVGDDFEVTGASQTGVNFSSFLKNKTGLKDASQLTIPMTDLTNSTFQSMFEGCTSMTAAPELPATTLNASCYLEMFKGCISLTTAPVLSATSLANYCYQSMFEGCSSLTTAPVLPAGTLTNSCYKAMFKKSGLTASPRLAAKTLVNNCYEEMFSGCSSLVEITMIATSISASNCLKNWVSGVSTTGDFYRDRSVSIPVSSVNGIPPTNWVDRNEFYIEAVAAGTLSYSGSGLQYSVDWDEWKDFPMAGLPLAAGDLVRFRRTSKVDGAFSSTEAFKVGGEILSLVAGKNYPTATLTISEAFKGLFKGASTLVSAENLILPATVTANCYEEMFSGSTSLTSAPTLSATTLTTSCYKSMFSGCTSLATAPTLSATTLAANCYEAMFSGCTSLTSAPALPATDLAANCYEAMFQNCTTLDATPTLPARTLAQECYKSMFAGCTNLTVSPQLPAETLVDGCYDNMFNGCSNLAKVYCSATTNLGIGFTTNWLANVAASGLFVKDESVTTWPQPSPSGIPDGWTIPWSGFKIRAITDNTKITFNYNYTNDGIEYSLNEGKDWTHYTAAFYLKAGQVACIRGNRTNYMNVGTDQWGTPSNKPIFEASSKCYISGNIMSLLKDGVLLESAFQGAFSKGGTAITYIDIDPDSPLILPETTLASKCYMQMFRNCTSLTRAPVFRAEVVNYRSCYNMFRGCTGLLSAEGIELPATTLAVDCYRELFRDCTNLASAAPDLPAPTLVQSCYQQMFSKTKITSLVCLATNISATSCTENWMSDVTNNNTRTFYKASSMQVGVSGGWTRGNNGIPSNWKVENYSGQ